MSSSDPKSSLGSVSYGSYKSESTALYHVPLVIEPTTQHEKTFIILHGRGDEGDHFGPQLLAWPIGKDQTLRSVFPTARFVFPTAARRRAQAFNRSKTHQWFDNYSPLSVEGQRIHETWQLEGLRETTHFVHKLIHQEVSIIGAENVILGGLSQGCAASMIAILLWDGPPLRAMFGMCGWLPLREHIELIADPPPSIDRGDGSTVVFEQAEGDAEGKVDPCSEALRALREELDLPIRHSTPSMVFQQVPIYLGHGTLDEKVPIGLGQEAVHCLRSLRCTVESREYEGLDHWYSGRMLADIAKFLTTIGGDQVNENTHKAQQTCTTTYSHAPPL